ncbi:hypothetical protein PPL_04839 [Heterostelium album PN500]|uniref:Uncharacterized protein n=1 Tax=Heterostelium pallidum (strain ATCC 26659 / Pp 5 / PN500) TaxID=670386 RepID=D3B8P6_HETP5|nr:hypothetical protein PPL_04839 [Heterostelium album PN500]EFA82414.1 hypothetical protein PPL_04839 [Heterostelium album PN500]|eukprot:XP_020434531.1 hypothetical protein PPL_04839 [Heterostelium album PN500]
MYLKFNVISLILLYSTVVFVVFGDLSRLGTLAKEQQEQQEQQQQQHNIIVNNNEYDQSPLQSMLYSQNILDAQPLFTTASNETQTITYSKFTFKHFLIILVVFGALLFFSFSIIQVRIKLKNNMVERIPRKIMPFLRPGDLSNKQRTVILNEIVKSKQTQAQIKPQIGDHPIGHLGWGSPGSEYAKVHFKTSISKSWIILERAAIHFDPELKREPKMCIRDYVNLLLERCPQMNKSLAKLYVDTYEKARFSELEFTLDEYTHFMSKFFVLLQDLEKDTSKLVSPSF